VAEPGQRGGELRGIQQIAADLGITARTLRFYEDKGLIAPRRVGNVRVYTRREVGRMHLILRGKRLGFTLRDIKEFLDLYDADPQHVEQMRRLARRARGRIAELEQQKLAIEQTLAELREIEQQAVARVMAVGQG